MSKKIVAEPNKTTIAQRCSLTPPSGVLFVDTEITTVRASIPEEFTSLVHLLRQHQWKFNMTTQNHLGDFTRARVSAERESWGEMSVSGYTFAYLSVDISAEQITFTLRKLVELCLRMEETFVGVMPSMIVSQDGCIYEDPTLTALANESNMALLTHLADCHRNKTVREADVSMDRGFLTLHWDSSCVLLNQTELDAIEEFIDGSA